MGHTRLGRIPKSRKWDEVVRAIAESATEGYASSNISDNVREIASRTLIAAQGGLDSALNDLGLRYTFYIITQIALSSKEDDWLNRLNDLGIRVHGESTLEDVTTEMQVAIDEHLFAHKYSTDIGEMAQKAAGEAVMALTSHKSKDIFGEGLEQAQIAIKDLSTKKGFSTLGQKFFGLFLAKYLNFYLSRVMVRNIKEQTIGQIGEISHFNEILRMHCEQSAKVVHDFCGEWYSKTEFVSGINLINTSGFVAVSVKKLQAELKQQEMSV